MNKVAGLRAGPSKHGGFSDAILLKEDRVRKSAEVAISAILTVLLAVIAWWILLR